MLALVADRAYALMTFLKSDWLFYLNLEPSLLLQKLLPKPQKYGGSPITRLSLSQVII